ncbi:U32 family peptidase [Scatolibacter rhodanostii]|uniref:U32 family peptidase n=1 Tax=Scatolibacter rhodanostii TaxID=2014781 RepID=UPI001180F9DB|nr:U32 family peptidase [Scatolibacter rhodanostii]
MKNKIEVLAPAGSWDSLQAAVYAGADAVYLAGQSFGARASAQNFTNEELAEAAAFCHARNVKLYITVNTLIKDREMQEALEFIRFLCEIAVDAVIVQDMGLFREIRRCAPNLVVHASTQMSLHSRAGVQLLKDNGAQRVVLAREISLAETEEITKACEIETESFVHGALCVSVSGQCYFSATLGSRSGNRGMCAQPCRLPFLADGGNGHALSLKDLSYIEEVEKLENAGVTSAKIEGRMKRPEYVAAAVSACRKAADGEDIPEDLKSSLNSVFSRSGFTKGYFEGKIDENMLGIRTKQDVTAATEKVFGSLRGLYRKELSRVDVSFLLSVDDLVKLTAVDEQNNHAEMCVPTEEGRLLEKERCILQLSKTGGTPFKAQNIVVEKASVPITISTLNNMRREVLKTLLKTREQSDKIEFLCKTDFMNEFHQNNLENKKKTKMPLVVSYRSWKQVTAETSSLDKIVLPLSTDFSQLKKFEIPNNKIILEIPRVIFGLSSEEKIKQKMQEHMLVGRKAFLCQNIGALQLCKELGAEAHGGFSLNILNSKSLAFFAENGLKSAELSPEITLKEMMDLGNEVPKGVMLYGRQALMMTRKCPVKSEKHPCRNCTGTTALIDRQKKEFPVMCTLSGMNKYTEVFNSVPLWMADRLPEVKGADYGILRFTVENAVECDQILKAFNRQEKPVFDYTRGLFYRGIQ